MAASIEVLEPEALGALVPEWEDLAARALEPNPFYEPWMLLPALRHFDAGEALVLTTRIGGRLSGVFPLRRERGFRGLPVSTLSSWRHPHCLLCTPLVARDGARESLSALRNWGGAAVLELKYFPSAGAFHRILSPTLALDRYERAFLRKEQNAERYIETALSGDLRRRLRRLEKRLRERGALEYRVLGPRREDNDSALAWIEEFLALEAAGWKGRQGSALASGAANLGFAREVLSEAARRGRLLMSGIDFDGRPIARRCSFLAGQGSYAWKSAYDEAFAAYSPGVLAEVHNIRVLHSLPGTQWMDSFTDTGNAMINRLWKERIGVQSAAIAGGAAGLAALRALPVLRWMKRQVLERKSGAASAPCTTAASP